jgi:predicted amidophosphoribosyltransferase
MVCAVCHVPAAAMLCRSCRSGLVPAPERLLEGGLRVVAGFSHEGPAKTLIHELKYRGSVGYARLVAEVIGRRVPPLPLVPVPRALSRLVRYGVDPAVELARAVSRVTGAPMIRALGRPVHTPRRAGGDHDRVPAPFRVAGPLPPSVVVVDDVVTTGATVLAAIGSIGPERVALVVAANSAKRGV